ncbi:MAG: dTDP-glucose 4,6-dehydratase [Proteobacteria bacterium]|jgi:dTDP-glucose 4,6-dehydratase|nr:dTDP-glucose 4,6-dehydratase [Alphaproteobacteria bacterium]NCC04067.1 dTDP-glucose 4,6-dehydratase [Pseudomonadota bacterium]
MQTLIVTGAAGFIGSALCRYLRKENLARLIGVDALTYAGSRESLGNLQGDPDFTFVHADVSDAARLSELFMETMPDGLIHLAAETHVDRSIDTPSVFLRTNVVGTFSLLETTRIYLTQIMPEKRKSFRFLHVSTDEVYGSLGATGTFHEDTAYAPNSPYAATKACADHLVRAWHKTYGLPVIISNCSNNYGPLQFPEKLIPLCITKALHGEKIPVYGHGENVRDWLYVDDHAKALYTILTQGQTGEKYNIGGAQEHRNIDLVTSICDILDEMLPESLYRPHRNLITFVTDRPGHDERYAMDFSKLTRELGWKPETSFDEGLRSTIAWYLNNQPWCNAIRARKYAGQRLGTGA